MHIFPTYNGNTKLQGSTAGGFSGRQFQSPPFQSTSTTPQPPPPSRPRHLQSTIIERRMEYDSDDEDSYDSEDDLDRPPTRDGLTILPSMHLIHPAVRDASLRLPPLLNNPHARLYQGQGQGESLPPLYRQFMRELSSNPSTPPALPDVDPPSVPRETCVELRKYHINPAWVVLPPFGEPCHFRSKESCFRADWRNAMWERHIQTHLPSTMKEFWECPHCLRPFNRKCAFVNHLRKTKTECGSRGTLEMTPESRWKDLWFHEPMPLRHPEDVPRRRWHSSQKEEQMMV